jgi:putative oxidoreductase
MLIDTNLQNLGLLVLRIAIAAIFLVHGTNKLKKWKQIPGFFRFLGICETLGGLAVLSGFLTQIASIGLAIIMLGALHHKLFKWHIPFTSEQTTGWEFDLLILAGVLALLIFGAGNISIDALIGWWP